VRGNLTRRGRHSWRLKYDVPVGNAGRQTKYVTLKGSKAEAQREAAKIMASLATGSHVDPSTETVGEFIAHWLDGAHELAGTTVERYRQLAQHQIIPHFGTMPLQKLRRGHLMEWHSKLLATGGTDGRPLSARTVKHAHFVLHRALERAVEGELIARNVAHGVRAPKVETTEIAILKADQIAAVLAALVGHPLYPIVVLALTSGARRGELLALRWSDVDLTTGTIRIERSLEQTSAGLKFKRPKTRHGVRSIALPPVAVEALHVHRRKQLELRLALGQGKANPDTLVFSTIEGEPMLPNGLSRDWGKFVRTHKLPIVTFHALRHTHASTLIAAGLDVLTISRRLGHGSPTITLGVYGHLFTNTDDKAAAIMQVALKGSN
jgi:integrase